MLSCGGSRLRRKDEHGQIAVVCSAVITALFAIAKSIIFHSAMVSGISSRQPTEENRIMIFKKVKKKNAAKFSLRWKILLNPKKSIMWIYIYIVDRMASIEWLGLGSVA